MNTMHRMVYPFLAVFGRGLGVDLPALSIALTTRSAVGVFSPFLASVADTRGRKVGMLLGVLLFVFGTGIVVIWPTYTIFFLALIITMFGKYIFDPSMQAYIGDQVSYDRRGRVLAITELGWSLSFVIGVPLVGFLIARQGWMAPFPLLTILGLLSLGGLYLLLPKDPMPDENRPSMWRNFQAVLTYAPALLGLSMGFLISSANEVVNLVFGVWLEDAFALQITALGAAAAVIGLAELGGESLSAGFTDRLGKLNSVGLGIVLNIMAGLALPFLARSMPGAVLGLFLFYITFEFTVVSIIPLMTEILPSARATLLSVNIAIASLGRALGAFLAVPIYNWGIIGNVLAAAAFNLLALLMVYLLNRAVWGRDNS
jgi:predicted MFS family arabinose efflux permease